VYGDALDCLEAQAQTLTLLNTIFLQPKGYPYPGLDKDNDSFFHRMKAYATNPHDNILGLQPREKMLVDTTVNFLFLQNSDEKEILQTEFC